MGTRKNKMYDGSYDLTIASELYKFSADCDEAVFECPQSSNNSTIELPETEYASPVEIYRYFQDESILFSMAEKYEKMTGGICEISFEKAMLEKLIDKTKFGE